MRELVKRLESDLLFLQLVWESHIDLFQHSKERVAMLNAVADNFFWIYDRMACRDLSSGIARLLDNLTTCGKDNLVLESLISEADPTIREALRAELKDLRILSKAVIEFRHEVVAHRGFQAATVGRKHPLNFHEVLPRIHQFIYLAQGKTAPPFGRQENEHYNGGAVDLVSALERVRTVRHVQEPDSFDIHHG